MAYIAMAHIAMAHIAMAYIAMAYIAMAYIAMADACPCGSHTPNCAYFNHNKGSTQCFLKDIGAEPGL